MERPEERPESDCPNGHGPMIFYASTEEDELDDYLECPECDARKTFPGRRSA